MFQNGPIAVQKRNSDLMVPAILAATLLLGGFTAFGIVVLGYEIVAVFRR
ncbi:hypothetical protein [Methylobacterium oxalidis]|nr:hypothetical protein [Methylobacterium oxalidis]GJE34838.1 hypothetical protein LDDCCGHA_5053 [Methylobacterium oxalidis]